MSKDKNNKLETVPLGSLANFRNGVNYNKDNFGRGIKVINVKDFQDYLVPKYEYLGEINPEGIIREKSLLQNGDIIFVRSNGNRELIGRSLFIREISEKVTHSAFTIKVRFNSDLVLPRFYAYVFRTSLIRQTLTAYGSGTNISNLNQEILSNLQVPLPPLSIQKRVVDILSAYDDLIENNTRRIKILEEMAQALYREWFVEFRFPGHGKVKMVESEFGMVPEGWEVVKIGEILKKVKRGTKILKKDYATEGLIPIVDQGKEFLGGYTDNTESQISDDLPLIIFGDHTRVLKFIDFPFACGADGTQLLKSNDERMPMTLFYYALMSIDLSDFAYTRHFKFLKDENLFLPAKSISDIFNQFVSSLRDQTRSLMQKNINLLRTRDLLLPKLILGEVDVEKIDIKMPGNGGS